MWEYFQVSAFVGSFFAEIAGNIDMDDGIKLIERYSNQFKLLELQRQEFGIQIDFLESYCFIFTPMVMCSSRCEAKFKWMILFYQSIRPDAAAAAMNSESGKTIRHAVQRVHRFRAREKRIWRHEYCECWFIQSFFVWNEFTFRALNQIWVGVFFCVKFYSLFDFDSKPITMDTITCIRSYSDTHTNPLHSRIALCAFLLLLLFVCGGLDHSSMADFQDLQAGKIGQRQLVENTVEPMQSVPIVRWNQRIYQRIRESGPMGKNACIDYSFEWCK